MRTAGGGKVRGYMLMEALLAVTIFSLGIITLGRCVSNCVSAERLKEEDALARRALENRWAEIESGAVAAPGAGTGPGGGGGISTLSEELKGPFAGMKMKMMSVPVVKKNEKDEKIEGISAVTLEVTWESDHEEQTKELMFYVYPRRK